VLGRTPDGGTTLRGTVAPPAASLPVFIVFSVVWVVVTFAMIATGVNGIASGSAAGLPLLVVPAILDAAYAAVVVTAPRQIRSDSQLLLDDLSQILGSTGTIDP
jgi:hypothetical protein